MPDFDRLIYRFICDFISGVETPPSGVVGKFRSLADRSTYLEFVWSVIGEFKFAS